MRIFALLLGCCVILAAAPAFADDPAASDAPSKVPAYIGTAVTAGFLVTSVVSYFGYKSALEERRDKVGAQRDDWYQAADRAARWHDIGIFSVGATIVAGGITGYLWSRTERPPQLFQVTADGSGASAWVTGTF